MSESQSSETLALTRQISPIILAPQSLPFGTYPMALLMSLSMLLRKELPMKKLPSLFPALARPALPVLPARSRALVRPNC